MQLEQAAKTILEAGCSGTAQLTWNIRKELNGGCEPDYSPGDAPYDDKALHRAVVGALKSLEKN